MLGFKVRRSAKVFDNRMGRGQILVSDPEGIRYDEDADSRIGETEIQPICWRKNWDDQWEWIDAYWLPDESKIFIDDIMKLEEGQGVMFFMPEDNGFEG